MQFGQDKATNPFDGLDRVVAMSWPVSFPDREKQAAAWIVRNNRLRNVYFALKCPFNVAGERAKKKMT